ncbi:hypothetical protein ACQ4PT_022119 [Festuca glaucescens]
MDMGENNYWHNSIQSVGTDVSFTDLLNMVAKDAEMSKFPVDRSSQLNEEMVLGGGEDILIEKSISDIETRSGAYMEDGICDGNVNFSMETSMQPEADFTRRLALHLSLANLLAEDGGAVDVTSHAREFHGGLIEESMRKYCEDKQTVMFEPELGMEFSSTEEAFQFYNMYSWVSGFSIRLGDNYTTKSKQRTMQEYLCQRQGNGDETKNSTTRCGCKAMMRVATNESCKCLFGSMDKVPFSKKTLRTVCSNIAKEALVDDVQKTLQSFREKISRDPRFVFTAELDEDNRLNSLMWTSGRSRSLYQHFGDVITFDTTYETNIYKMPFGMFVGVNNHFQSVIFAGVLLTNETAANFKWAFEEFVAMMGGKAPQTILTDQSLAMTIAIKENLVNTNHRWCKWHILRKAQEALGHVHKLHSTFSDEFNKVVNHMLTPEEFEAGWEFLTKKYDLAGNPFMTRAFEVRDKWAKPYFNDIFCARMSSTQRSESANHVLKVYVPCKSSINMFVKQYTKLIDDREKADDEAEKNKSQKTSKTMFGYPIEKHASKLYTPAVFKLFKAELRKTTSYVVVANSGGICYEVMHVDYENRDAWSRVNFTITYDPQTGLYKCQCRLYEHFGIICCHIMLVMTQSGVMQIPECHIMKRWTVYARAGSCGKAGKSYAVQDDEASRTLRHKNLYMQVLDLVSAGEYDETTSDLAIKYVEVAKKKIEEYKMTISRTCQVGYNLRTANNDDQPVNMEGTGETGDTSSCGLQLFDRAQNCGIEVSSIKAPIVKLKMGRPTNKRYLTRFDSNIRRNKGGVNWKKKVSAPGGRTGVHQTRFCSCCKSPDHDIRTCPSKPDYNVQPRKKGKQSTTDYFKF